MLHSDLSVIPLSIEDEVCNCCGQRIDLRLGDPHETAGPGTGIGSRAPSLAAGMLLANRYRIVTRVGHGGMGDVYQAEDLILEQMVALKSFPAWVKENRSAREQFYREVKLARQVSHPNVCRVFDIGKTEVLAFITMEFVDGENLQSLLARIGRLTYDKALEVAHQICAGLAAAHDRGVLHRDLKPANIMLDGRGNIRITDFGLAVTAGESGQARSGTPIYMAPELLRGQEASVSTDLYAVGLVLYEIFTGSLPFTMESVAAARTDSIHPLTQTNLDPGLEQVILWCLAADPDARPGSAMEVVEALQAAFIPGQPVRNASSLFDHYEQIRSFAMVMILIIPAALLATYWTGMRNPLTVLLTWIWCVVLQSLITLFSAAYMLRRGLRPSCPQETSKA